MQSVARRLFYFIQLDDEASFLLTVVFVRFIPDDVKVAKTLFLFFLNETGGYKMRKNKGWLIIFVLEICVWNFVYATPSTQIWNPSTDIQKVKTWHLGIDNYFSVTDNERRPYSFPTDIGLTYGLFEQFELGIDLFYPAANPVYFNFKYGIAEQNVIPSIAVGMCSVGTKKDVTDYDIFYGILAKNVPIIGQLSLGCYYGNEKLLVDENGNKNNLGLICTCARALTDKLWVCIDYASGKSFYGSFSFGLSYNFAPNISILFGYVIYTNKTVNVNDTFTTQLDINF